VLQPHAHRDLCFELLPSLVDYLPEHGFVDHFRRLQRGLLCLADSIGLCD
jgi:hypothetical protein